MTLLQTAGLGLLAITCLVPTLLAQSFEARHLRELAANPGDLHFRLGTVGDTKSFHRGERITLTLEFWSDSPETYKLNGATYDRSGRLPTEEFVLERGDVIDPYSDYFSIGVLGGIAGGLRSNPTLNESAFKIELSLNDWFRFDQPGIYRLYLKSHRLTREHTPKVSGEMIIPFPAVSNALELTILPEDANWTAAKLREIESVLGQPEPKLPKPGGPLEDKLRLAREELRYLASPAALDLAFQDARKFGTSPDTLALIGVRDRRQAVAAFDRYLADPETNITGWDLRVRALFTFIQKEAPQPLPLFRWELPEGADTKKLQTQAEARWNRFKDYVRAEAIRLIPVAAAKNKASRKASGEAIATIAPDEARAAQLVPPEDYGLSREELISQFPKFPVEQQTQLLEKKWDLVRGPEMIPALRSVIGQATPGILPDTATGLQVWGMGIGVAETALRRLHELSPEEAYRVVTNDIASGRLSFAGFAVRELEARDMPEADPMFAAWLGENKRGALPLIAKFATARIAPAMRDRYVAGSSPCDEEASFLAYFVRSLPASGPKSAGQFLQQALAAREGRGCHHSLLNQVGQVIWKPVLEAQAIESLNDPDPETAESAARALAADGGPEAEPSLWKRLEEWSKLRHSNMPDAESGLGPTLFHAIASAKSWRLDAARRQRLRALCVDDQCRKDWAQTSPGAAQIIGVANGGGLYPSAFRVDGYTASTFETLKKILQQFPSGTTFRWCPQAYSPFDRFSEGQRNDMFQDLKSLLTARSMNIEPYDERKCLPGYQ